MFALLIPGLDENYLVTRQMRHHIHQYQIQGVQENMCQKLPPLLPRQHWTAIGCTENGHSKEGLYNHNAYEGGFEDVRVCVREGVRM